MFHLALLEPEIPPNTGNIIRLAANTGAQLHLIGPLGFSMDDRALRRAGLDYHEYAQVAQHESYPDFLTTVQPTRVYAFSTRGRRSYADVTYQAGDALLFGPETRGLPQALLNELPQEQVIRIPMRPHARSLNLSNSAAIACYEAWRQHDFEQA